MENREFKVIYDILQEGYFGLSWNSIWWFIGVLLVFILIIALRRNPNFNKSAQTFVITVVSVLLAVGIWSVYSTLSTQKTCVDWAKNNNFQIVTGEIKDFRSDFKSESFLVNGVKFVYGEYDLTKCGYRQAKGVRLQNDKLVRISYREGCILKLELAE